MGVASPRISFTLVRVFLMCSCHHSLCFLPYNMSTSRSLFLSPNKQWSSRVSSPSAATETASTFKTHRICSSLFRVHTKCLDPYHCPPKERCSPKYCCGDKIVTNIMMLLTPSSYYGVGKLQLLTLSSTLPPIDCQKEHP